MGKVYTKQLIEGVDIPGIIHNSSYFLSRLAVYENGTVSCWRRCDLKEFEKELCRGWVVPQIPLGKTLSVFELGEFQVIAAKWRYDAKGYYRHVQEIVRQLNPEMSNIYRTSQREKEKWEQHRVQWSASPTYCKLTGKIGYQLTDGESAYIFYRTPQGLELTTLTAYGDKTVQIEAGGEDYLTPETVDEWFAAGTLTTGPEQEEWVNIEGLGRLLLAPEAYPLSVKEKQQEIRQMIKRAAGEEDAHAQCIAAYQDYLFDPCDWTRERLRETYEAVPELVRMYLGDMDSRDGDFRRILYTDVKREV